MKRRIFVLGDSISIQYGPYLKSIIEDDFLYDSKRGEELALQDLDTPMGANGGDSRNVLRYLLEPETRRYLENAMLVLNCGLHDIKTNPQTNQIQVPVAEYKENLTKIFDFTKASGIYTIWVNTTPVDDRRHRALNGEFLRFDSDVVRYNSTAFQLTEIYEIPVIDLYSFTRRLAGGIYCDHVHFTEAVRKLQAAFIAGHIFFSSWVCPAEKKENARTKAGL